MRSSLFRSPAIHPPIIACFPILSLYAINAESVEIGELALPSAVALALVGLVWAIAARGLHSGARGALFASIAALAFWAQSYVMLALGQLWPAAGTGGALAVAAVSVLAVVAATRGLMRSNGNLVDPTRIANAVALAALAIVLLTGAPALWRVASQSEVDRDRPSPETASALGGKPDIYLIVLDAYGRADELAEHFDFENGLAERLTRLGFFVADQSVSNYNHTATSVPSLLNFDYIPNLTKDPSLLTLGRLVRRNAVARTLAPLGYEFVACASGYNVTECPAADRYLEPTPPFRLFGRELRPSDFELALLGKTPVEPWLRRSEEASPYVQHRRRILHCLDSLAELASDPKPTFTFAHLLAPHEPFVFGPLGEDVSPYDLRFNVARIYRDADLPDTPGQVGPDYARRYRDQIRFVSDRVEAVVEEILRRSPEEPIIIVQGDHGPYGFSPDIRRARFPILNAIRLPGTAERALYRSITPVNTFRLILRRHFGLALDRLEDRSFVDSPDAATRRFVPARPADLGEPAPRRRAP